MRFALILFTLAFGQFTLSAEKVQPKQFEAFTGKVTGNSVRFRLAPSLDGQVFKELSRDDLVLVTGVVDDFYACMPPKGLKGYIFRTYVLDGVVEGSNVFVRLGPDRSAPAITTLNSGDEVKGTISATNNKWLEISLPADVRFYVAKDYVKQVGDPSFLEKHEARKADAMKALAEAETQLNKELQKPFPKIQLAPIAATLTKLASDNKDMPQLVSQTEALISRMQESYLAKSVAYGDETPALQEPPKAQEKVKEPLKEVPVQHTTATTEKKQPVTPPPAPAKPLSTISWQDRESAFLTKDNVENEQLFYAEEMKSADTLLGTVKPYNSFIATRPGDFVLINIKTNLPIAYLYSTKVDLASWINKPVTLWVSKRPNNNFAFPAYFVHKVEE